MQPPAQELVAKDLHDNTWAFRHIYRGIASLDTFFIRQNLTFICNHQHRVCFIDAPLKPRSSVFEC